MNSESILRCLALLLVFIFTQSLVAEVRTWTDQRGRTFKGTFVEADAEEVTILREGGGEVRVKRAILSAQDNEWLKEYGGASSAIVEGAKVGTPEKSVRIDSQQFKELEEGFIFPDSEVTFKMLQSDHFITMTHGRVRPKDIAETAERLWHGMSFQHPGFKDKWGNKRRAIFVIEDEEVHNMVGDYYQKYLSSTSEQGIIEATKVAITWPKSSGGTIPLTAEIADGHDLFQSARVFRVTKENAESYKDVFTPFVTHCLANDMLSTATGGTSGFGSAGYFSLLTGHAYYKEIQLAGKSGTSLISAEYDSSEIQSARGFADGTGWAKELKKLVRRDAVTPSVADVYTYQAQGLQPEQLVLLYSLSYYMQSTPERLAAYAKMIERIETSKQVPEAIEIAKLFGFETVEELEADWKAFLESSDFK